MCHNEGLPAVDMPVMIHKIHTAQMVGTHDFTEVTYPQDPRNCATCHDGSDPLTPQGDNWKNVPNRKACGACHADVDFATGTNHVGGVQATDQVCTLCHGAADIVAKHATEEFTTHNPQLPAGLSVIAYDLVEARVTGTTLEVDFSITRDGTPLDLLALPADLTTSTNRPSFVAAYALPQGGIEAPADYNNLGRSAGQPATYSIGTLLGAGAIAAKGGGVFTATIADAFPENAQMRAVGLQGYFQQTVASGNVARHARSVVVPVTGDRARRQVVAMDKCLGCHETLQLHGGNRVDDPAICLMCHNPNLTSSGRSADPTVVPDATKAEVGDNPLLYPEEGMNLQTLVHAAHSAEARESKFEFVRNRNGGLYYDFSEITFPGILQNCETCHLPNTYGPVLSAGILPTTYVTTSGPGADRAALLAARDSVPNASDLASSPLAAACYGCHASTAVESHIESNGGIIAEPRSSAGLTD
jgi:OmcA/MtrC family decaheme c-type cytochrome